MSLFWRLFLANAATLGVGYALLVSGAPEILDAHGLGTLLLGAAALMLVNAAVVGHSLAGISQLRQALSEGDDLSVRMPRGSAVEVDELAAAYERMRTKLTRERQLTARAALRAQEDERRTIARDLHDEVGQNLTFLLLRLSEVSKEAPAELADDLDAVAEAARATLDQVRQISRQLRPGVLDDLGLRPALAALVDDVGRLGLDAALEFPAGLGEAAERDLVVYRIVQEALTNVVKHAGAGSVRVVVRVDADDLVVTVTDDGTGVLGVEGTGTGSMRERAQLVGGTFERTATPGKGTEVRVRLPVTIGSDGIDSPTHPIPTIRLSPLTRALLQGRSRS